MKRVLTALAILGLGTLFGAGGDPARADVRILLEDGRYLEGRDVWREGDDYALETSPGDVLIVPSTFVAEVQIAGEEPEPPEEDPEAWRTRSGVQRAEPRTLEGGEPDEETPSGIDRDTGPRTLAGDPVEPPRRADQLRVFGGEAGFRKDVVRNDWEPTTDWDMTNGANDWAPSTWQRGISDSSWSPDSAFGAKDDVLESSRSQWRKSVVESSWQPKDAWSK